MCVCNFKTQPLDGAKRQVRGVSDPPPVQTAVFTVFIDNALKKQKQKNIVDIALRAKMST